MKPTLTALSCSVLLVACGTPDAPDVSRLAERSGVITLPDPDTGMCRANDVTPAVIETITERYVVQPAIYTADGRVSAPAKYRTESRPVIIQERTEQQFDALCEADLTPDYVSNLQRALTVRGFYNGPINGALNWRTRRAVRLYQQDQGIDSAILSLKTARQLGLTAIELDR